MFAPTLRRLAVAIVALLGITVGTLANAAPSGAAGHLITINGGCRVAGDPHSMYITGTLFVEPSEWIYTFIGFFVPGHGPSYLPFIYNPPLVFATQLDITGRGPNGGYEFSYRTPDSKTLPLSPVVIDWAVYYDGLNAQGDGSFRLAATCATPAGNSGTSGTIVISPATQVGVQVIVGGILRDKLTGDFSPKAMKETLKGGHLVGLTGSASLKDNNGNPSKAIWSLKRANYQKPWKGSVRIVDQSMQIASAFGRSLKASRAKDGRITGSADAEVKGDTKSGIATLKFALAAAA